LPASPAQTGALALLREEPQFRLFFAGQALSVIGDRIAPVAIAFAVLDDLHGTPGQLGIVVAAGTIPFAAFAFAAGVWGDRWPRLAIMVTSDLVRLVVQAVAGVLLLSGHAQVWQLAVLAAVYGTADSFFMPAINGLMPEVVAAPRLQQANALRGVMQSSGLVFGPVIAGVLIAAGSPGAALLVDAATFAVSAACLARLKPRSVPRDDPPPELGDGFVAQLRAGWREVRARPWVSKILVAMSAYHLIVLPSIFVLGPVLADRELDGASSWAVIVAAFGAGSIAGNVLLLRLHPRRPVRFAALCLMVASCQAAIIGSGLGTGGIAALEALTGVAVSGFFTLWETALQERIAPHLISRVTSYDFFTSVGLMPIGLALAGPISQAVGLHTTLYAMSAIGVAVSAAAALSPAVSQVTRGPTAGPGRAA
jgi:MFS family permease